MWNGIGRFNRTNLKNSGRSTALTTRMKALLPSIGCKMLRIFHLKCHLSMSGCRCFKLLGFVVFRRGHMFDYTCAVIIYEMCIQEPAATVSVTEVARNSCFTTNGAVKLSLTVPNYNHEWYWGSACSKVRQLEWSTTKLIDKLH